MSLVTFLGSNYGAILALLSGLIGLAEVIVRLFFPGELGAVQRLGSAITEIMNILKVPNVVTLADGTKVNINSPTYVAPAAAQVAAPEAAQAEAPKAS